MIIINKAIMHILDFNSGISVFSEEELEIGNECVTAFLAKHIEKSYHDSNLKSGAFLDNSRFKKQMNNYMNKGLDFIAFSTYIADTVYSSISKSDKLDSQDLFVCDVNLDSDHIIAILLCTNRVGFTHQVVKNNNKIRNEIIYHYSILPNNTQKIDECAFIGVTSSDIKFHDKKRYIDGKDVFIIPEVLLECSSSFSPKYTVELVNSITRMVAENHGQSSALAISKAKKYLAENIEVSEEIDTIELGKEVFNFSPIMQEEFIHEARNAGVPEKVIINKNYAIKASRNHKIKTDTGIEISFPADYFQNKDYIEFINNSDGTLSIEIKNIGKIINK